MKKLFVLVVFSMISIVTRASSSEELVYLDDTTLFDALNVNGTVDDTDPSFVRFFKTVGGLECEYAVNRENNEFFMAACSLKSSPAGDIDIFDSLNVPKILKNRKVIKGVSRLICEGIISSETMKTIEAKCEFN